MQKTEFHRIAAIATSAVVAASAFAIAPVTANSASPRNTNADVALTAAPAYDNPCPSGVQPNCLPTVAQAYTNLFNPFTQEAIDWIADPALNGTWTVAPAAPGDVDVYALLQASDGRWLLYAPTGAEDEDLVKLVAAAEEQGWTLQNVSGTYPDAAPLYNITPCNGTGCGLQGYAAQAGVGALTAAIASPFPIVRQIANNLAFYAGLLGTVPLDEAIATIVATVAAHAQAVAAVVPEALGLEVEATFQRVAAVAMAAMTATKYVAAELTTAFGSGQALAAFRAGFVSPLGYDGTVASSLPGTLLAVTTGPGQQPNPATCNEDQGTIKCDVAYVPSVVGGAQLVGAQIVNALGGYRGQPAPGCSSTTGSCIPPAATRAQALAHPQPAAARSATSTTNVRAAAATTSAAVDSADDIAADTASASTDTVQKPAGKHRAARSAASRSAAS